MPRFRIEGYGPAAFYRFEVEADDFWDARNRAVQRLMDEDDLPEPEHVTYPDVESATEIAEAERVGAEDEQ